MDNMYFGDSKPDGKKGGGSDGFGIPDDFNPGVFE